MAVKPIEIKVFVLFILIYSLTSLGGEMSSTEMASSASEEKGRVRA